MIDRSGSMRGEKLAQVREAALQVLAGLDDGEAFNVILYNEGVEALSDRPLRKSREAIRGATEFLEGMTARGGTNIHDALLEALRQPPSEGTLPIVLFAPSSGLPTVGFADLGKLRSVNWPGMGTHTSVGSSPSASGSTSIRPCWRRSPMRAGRRPRSFFPVRMSR